MSSGKSNFSKKTYEYEISEAIVKFSHKNHDIYSGEEQIQFKNRHPIYKTLLRIEFEDAIKEFLNL